MAMRKVLLIACGLMAVSLVNGCISMPDLASTNLEIRNAVDTLNRGIDVLAKESADWRLVIRDILDELPEEAQGTLRAEVTDLLERGIAATGSEFRCDMDFLRLRVREDLERIRHKHFGGPEPTPRRPYLCMAVPLIAAFVEDKDTNMTNVTRFLNIVTHYHMTLNLGGEAVGLNDDHRKILLFWDNSLQSAVSVIPAEYEEECTTQVKFVTPGTRTYTPPHTNIPGYNKGNRDFSGHGPKIDAEVTLKLGANRRGILATISMVAWEWNVSKNRPRSDYTAAAGETTEVIYLAPDGWRIRSYDVLNSARVSYIDSNHRDDIFPAGGMLPVEKWTFVGDTGGSEAGDKTKVQVKLSNFNVVIESCP
jgi:hypothetical protein